MQSISNNKLSSKRKRNRFSYLLLSFNFGLSQISELAIVYFLKDEIRLEPSGLGNVMAIILAPWMLKPFFGIVTDSLPIFGYRRKSYIILCGVLNLICWLLMAYQVKTLMETVLCLIVINATLSFSTVLSEAIIVELSQLDKLSGVDGAKDYVSLFFFFKYVGVLFSAYLRGYLVDLLTLRQNFLIASVLPLLMISSGFILIEERIISKEIQDGEANRLLALEGENNNTNQIIQPKISLSSEVFSFILQKQFVVPILFILIFTSVPSYTRTFFYFLTNELKFTPTDLGKFAFVATAATLIAIVFYKFFLTKTKFKKLIICISILSMSLSFMAFLLVKRINISLGIPDFWIVMFANAFEAAFGELIMMPVLSLAAAMCPKCVEGTVYAIFVSILNLGTMIASFLGAMLTNYFQVTSIDFRNLPAIIIMENLLTLVPLPMLIYLSDSYFEMPTKEKEDCEDEIVY